MSYAFLGYKWGVPDFGEPSGEITWSADLTGLGFNDAAYDLGDFEVSLGEAFQAWEDAAAIDFRQVASGGDVQVGVGTLSRPEFVAVTQWASTTTPGLEQFEFVTVTFDIEELWKLGGTGAPGFDFYAVAAHEIGHVIGLDHVSDASQLMYDFVGPPDLNDGDIMGAQVLYGKDAGDTDVGAIDAAPDESVFDSSGGGGAGGAILAILAALLALVSGIFTGGTGPLATLAAAQSRSEEDEETLRDWGDAALDLIPGVPVGDDAAALWDDDDLGEDLLDWV